MRETPSRPVAAVLLRVLSKCLSLSTWTGTSCMSGTGSSKTQATVSNMSDQWLAGAEACLSHLAFQASTNLPWICSIEPIFSLAVSSSPSSKECGCSKKSLRLLRCLKHLVAKAYRLIIFNANNACWVAAHDGFYRNSSWLLGVSKDCICIFVLRGCNLLDPGGTKWGFQFIC